LLKQNLSTYNKKHVLVIKHCKLKESNDTNCLCNSYTLIKCFAHMCQGGSCKAACWHCFAFNCIRKLILYDKLWFLSETICKCISINGSKVYKIYEGEIRRHSSSICTKLDHQNGHDTWLFSVCQYHVYFIMC